MYLESEVYQLLVVAFGMVAGVSAGALAGLYWKSRDRNIFWFAGQLIFLAFAFALFYKCITYRPNQGNSMYSEDQSITLALSGICWAISMAFNVIGIYKTVKKRT